MPARVNSPMHLERQVGRIRGVFVAPSKTAAMNASKVRWQK
jgi:hypothetical protein